MPLCQFYQPQYQQQEKQQHTCRTHEAFLLSHRAEDKVGILLWHELQLGLGSVEESLALQTARTDGNLTLMHIISGTSQILIQSQKHIDTHSLVRLHHVVQHVVGTVEEGNGTQREDGYQEIIPESRSQSVIYQETYHQCTEQQLNPYDIERDDEGGEKRHYQRDTDRICQNNQRMLLVARIGIHHARREYLHQQQHRKLTHRGIGIPHQHILVLDAHHKVGYHRDTRKQHGSRHSLAIEHQEEGGINQCRARFSLSHDADHRQQDDAHRRHEMLHVVDIETIARHKLRHSQCRSKLTKLGRLQSERSENQPGMRTLDAVRIEYRGKEQQYQHAIDDIREGIEKPVVHHQDNKAQGDGSANPHNLHARTGTQTENIIVTIGVAGTADADPAKAEQRQIDADGPPVKRTEYTSRLFIIAHNL